MNQKTRIVIVGATSAMAEHCGRKWVEGHAVDLTLVGRNQDRLGRVATDLRIRSPQSLIQTVVTDFMDSTSIQAAVESIVALGAVDMVLIAHGTLPDQVECQRDLDTCCAALLVNGVSPALFAEAFAKHFAHTQRGTLALIGSVAGDRGRRSNYVYGSAKGLLARYVEGLQHRFAGTDIKVVLIKPGPTETPMTAHLKDAGKPMASVQGVAADIVAAVERGAAVAYTPRRWHFIMLIIRHLPRFIFNRMEI